MTSGTREPTTSRFGNLGLCVDSKVLAAGGATLLGIAVGLGHGDTGRARSLGVSDCVRVRRRYAVRPESGVDV